MSLQQMTQRVKSMLMFKSQTAGPHNYLNNAAEKPNVLGVMSRSTLSVVCYCQLLLFSEYSSADRIKCFEPASSRNGATVEKRRSVPVLIPMLQCCSLD